MKFARQVMVGVFSGAAGALSMELFQLALRRISPQGKEWVDSATDSTHHPQTAGRRSTEARTGGRQPATAQAVQEVAFKPLSQRELKLGSEIVHYTTAILPGVIYAVWRDRKKFSFLDGATLGLIVFVVLNQTIVPTLGLSSRRDTSNTRNQEFSLVAHVLYGIATESMRSLINLFGN